MAVISQEVLDAISKAKDSKAASDQAGADHEAAVVAVEEAEAAEVDAAAAFSESQAVALEDAHAALAAVERELGLA